MIDLNGYISIMKNISLASVILIGNYMHLYLHKMDGHPYF